MNEAHQRRVVLKMLAGAVFVNRADALQEKLPISISDLLDGTAMVRVPEGEFEMGSADGNADESPVHRVRITRAFEVSRYEVTQAQWEGVMRNAHMKADVKTNFSHFHGLNLPVESVTWDEVQVFLKRLNDRDHDHTYRLPTEAEWEYACTDTAPAAASPRLEEVAWFAANAEDKTQPVGTKRPNSRGIFDMLGNVAEWVRDWYERDYYYQSPATDPQGPDAGSYRVYRGGCWFDEAKNCRCPYRGFDFPSNRVYNVGFRVVRTNRA
ncbi:MAG: hypothetical protein JWN34_5285 [Bryobacterales bacterium]|nr:hypothetical protein [Bryobacterales bacterium]